MKNDENRTVLITGAAEGLGRAYARYFSERGYRLILVSKHPERIRPYAEAMACKNGVQITVLKYDLSETHALSALLLEVDCHNIDVLVNNAAEEFAEQSQYLSGADRKKLIQVQVSTTVSLTLHILRIMITQNRGYIINLAAAPAKILNPQSSFCQSSCRMFICQFTEGLSTSLSGMNVYVQAVCPGIYYLSDDRKKDKLYKYKNTRNTISSDRIIMKAMNDLEKRMLVSSPGLKQKLFMHNLQEKDKKYQRRSKIS